MVHCTVLCRTYLFEDCFLVDDVLPLHVWVLA